MIATIAPSFVQVAAACFPVARCTVRGYTKATGYCLTLFPPQPWAGPAAYTGNGRTCYEALAAAVQLFHDSAHAYPDARPLAAAGSYSQPQQPREFPQDDEPAHDWPSTIRTAESNAQFLQQLRTITGRHSAAEAAPEPAVIDDTADYDEEEPEQEPEYDPNRCPHCYGAGVSHEQPDGCSGCNGSGKRKRGYWNNYGRDWDDSED